MRHTMRSEALTPERILAEAEREFVAVRARARPARRRALADLVPRSSGARRRRRAGPGRARRHRRRAPQGRGAARLLPRRDGADRGVLPGARPRRPRRRAARDPVDAGLPACVRRRDADLAGSARQGAEGVLRDHPDARRLDRRAARVEPARGQRPDAPPADDPRGGPGPLPPGRLRQPLPVARPGRSSAAACSPRAGPSTSPR